MDTGHIPSFGRGGLHEVDDFVERHRRGVEDSCVVGGACDQFVRNQ